MINTKPSPRIFGKPIAKPTLHTLTVRIPKRRATDPGSVQLTADARAFLDALVKELGVGEDAVITLALRSYANALHVSVGGKV